MEKQKVEKIDPHNLFNFFMQAQAPNFGTSPNEQRHRELAAHFLRSLQTWGYFQPHIHLAKDDQEVQYGTNPEKFKARLFFGIDFEVSAPVMPKQRFLELIYQQIYW